MENMLYWVYYLVDYKYITSIFNCYIIVTIVSHIDFCICFVTSSRVFCVQSK